jgi:tight adherence protein B
VRSRRPAVVLLALTALPWSAALGQPDEEPVVRASNIQTTDDSLRFVFSVGLRQGESIDTGSIQVSVAGESVDPAVTPLDEVDTDRIAVLAMDVSSSMGSEGKLDGAQDAAALFLDVVPPTVKVGLVTFSDAADPLIDPTTDHEQVRAAVEGLTLDSGTALYEGVLEAVGMAGDTGARTVILLSDGANTVPSGTIEEAVTAVSESGVTLDAVALGSGSQGAVDDLNRLADASQDGRVITTEQADDELEGVFAAAAREIASQVEVVTPLPTDRHGETVSVVVEAQAAGAPVEHEFAVTLPDQPVANPGGPVPVAAGGLTLSQPWLLAALGALFAGLAILLSVALVATGTTRTPQNRLMRRLSFYSLSGRGARRERTVTVLGTSAVARNAVEFAGRVIERRDVESTLMRRLDAAGVPVRPAEWVVIHTALAFGSGLLLLLLTGGSLTGLVFGLLLGALGPVGYLVVMESRRKAAFTTQLPETLQLMAGSLAAGYSMPQAIDTVVREGQQPIADELNRTLVETRLGVPLEDSLESVATRMQNQDFAWVVMAIKIQREVGGNLAEVLRTVAETLREREYLRRQVRALSAEGRFSALILAALPPLFALYLLFVRPDYLALLYSDPLGIAMVIVSLMLLGAGVLWMRKIVNIEV